MSEPEQKNHAVKAHPEHHTVEPEVSEAVHRIREKHQQKKQPQPRRKKRRLIFWTQISLVAFLLISIGLTVRAMELMSMKVSGTSWVQELEQGNIEQAADKFSILASDALAHVFDANLSSEQIMQDFNAALPHLKKAGYTLTELEVELGIPPKLIPHFYHDPDVKLNMERTLAALKDNGIGTALMHALKEAGSLQKELEVSDMKFSHIEVELGPIPSLKLQYKAQQVAGSAVRNARSASGTSSR